jgi:2-amino-4-hydroxy-6-hydroxymethyldihydropteridine diphosphokinase
MVTSSAEGQGAAPEDSGERIFIALGANLGHPRAALARAIHQLGSLPATRLVAQSSLWRTAPIDSSGPDYVNAVVELRSALAPQELLAAMQDIERRHGRRRPYRNAPRTLDLDLLFHGQRCIAEAGCTVPHPRLHLRAFVLEPLAELAPDWEHPILGSLRPWREQAADQRLVRLA